MGKWKDIPSLEGRYQASSKVRMVLYGNTRLIK